MHALIPHRQTGFSLVEALVAVLIVSIGLLGVTQLLLRSLSEVAAALWHTQAVNLVSDMMERIRANPEARDAYDCSSYINGPTEQGCVPSGAPAIECTPRQLAEDDLARWQGLVRQSLPSVPVGNCAVNVNYVAASGEQPARYRVKVPWQPPGTVASPSLEGELLIAMGPST